LHIAFEAKRVFQERSEGYDFFVYLEDDIQIHDREFFRKLAWFQNEFGPAALLQPVRVEMSGRGLPVKAVIDCDLPPVSLAPFRREGQVTQLAATWNGLTRRFALPGNPHAAFHAVSAEQLRLWMDHRTFATDDTQWIGPMESAATAALAPVFDIYKPVAPDAFFLEVEHFGAGHLSRLSGNSAWGEGPALAIIDEALRSLSERSDQDAGVVGPRSTLDPLRGYGTSVASVLVPRLREAERSFEYRRIMALDVTSKDCSRRWHVCGGVVRWVPRNACSRLGSRSASVRSVRIYEVFPGG